LTSFLHMGCFGRLCSAGRAKTTSAAAKAALMPCMPQEETAMTTRTAMELSHRALLAIALPAMAATAAQPQNSSQNSDAGIAKDAAAPPEDYPNHQVAFIVPFAPPGGTDILARLLAQKLEQELGKPFVVEN